MATQVETVTVPPTLALESKCVAKPCQQDSLPLAADTLQRLYTYMLKCRTMEERIRILFRQGRFAGNYFAAVGQEATQVGVTMDLLPEDTIAPSHRNFITHIMKGTPLKLMMAQIYAR